MPYIAEEVEVEVGVAVAVAVAAAATAAVVLGATLHTGIYMIIEQRKYTSYMGKSIT